MIQIIILAVALILLSLLFGVICIIMLAITSDYENEYPEDYSNFPVLESDDPDYCQLLMHELRKDAKQKSEQKPNDQECLIQNDPML
jgi:hypothetical protein